MSSLAVGIDVATAGVRAIVVDENGDVVAEKASSLPAPVRDPDGRSEQDARTWWPAACHALSAVTDALADRRGAISAVAIAATSGTIVAVDDNCEPVSPALMYDDRRGSSYNEKANEIGYRRWQALGMAVSPTAAIGRIAWLHDNPDIPAQRIAHTPDLIGGKLVGRHVATDSSHALKSGYDPLHEQWPVEVFEQLGLPTALLPEVVKPTTVLGEVSRWAAAETGLPAGCNVIAGMTDGCAGQLASGAVKPGQFVGILGTTYVLKGVTERLIADPSGAMYSHRHPAGWWLPGGASNTGGEAITAAKDLAELDEAAERRGPAKIISYPLLRSGERFPFVHGESRGFHLGTPADQIELHRANLEGVAFIERLALDHLRRLGIDIRNQLFTAGGGSMSRVWTTIRATVTGLALRRSAHAETGYGAAQLAAAAQLRGGVPEACARTSNTGELIEPDSTQQDALTISYQRFCIELHSRGWIDDGLLAAAIR